MCHIDFMSLIIITYSSLSGIWSEAIQSTKWKPKWIFIIQSSPHVPFPLIKNTGILRLNWDEGRRWRVQLNRGYYTPSIIQPMSWQRVFNKLWMFNGSLSSKQFYHAAVRLFVVICSVQVHPGAESNSSRFWDWSDRRALVGRANWQKVVREREELSINYSGLICIGPVSTHIAYWNINLGLCRRRDRRRRYYALPKSQSNMRQMPMTWEK